MTRPGDSDFPLCVQTCACYEPGKPYRNVAREQSRNGRCTFAKCDVWTGGIWSGCKHPGGPQLPLSLFDVSDPEGE